MLMDKSIKKYVDFFDSKDKFSDIRVICKNDEFSTIICGNKAFYDFIGYEEKEFEITYQNNFSNLIYDFLYREVVSMIEDCDDIDMKFRVKTKTGQLVWVEDKATYDRKLDVFFVCLKPHYENDPRSIAGVNNTSELSYKELSTYLFDFLYDYTIIIDIDTEEIFYLSDSILNALNNPPGIFWKDKRLSQIFDFNQYLSTQQIGATYSNNGYVISTVYNEKSKRYYEIKEKQVPLKSRFLLIKLITDITEKMKEELEVKDQLVLQQAINNCVQILHNKITEKPLIDMLDEVIKFYNADSVFILNYSDITRLYYISYESSLNNNHINEGVLSINFHNVANEILEENTILIDIGNFENYVLYNNRYFNNLIVSNINYSQASKGHLLCILNSRTYSKKTELSSHVSKFIANYFKKETIIDDLSKQVEMDQLTGLYNKVTTQNKIIQLLISGKVNNGAIIFIDIDDFKFINDTYGHLLGDQLLQQFAKNLRKKFRVSDIIGRVGGDEFLIFIYNYSDNSIFEKINDVIEELFIEYEVENKKKKLSVSYGVKTIDSNNIDFDDLYKKADKEMYKYKLNKKI